MQIICLQFFLLIFSPSMLRNPIINKSKHQKSLPLRISSSTASLPDKENHSSNNFNTNTSNSIQANIFKTSAPLKNPSSQNILCSSSTSNLNTQHNGNLNQFSTCFKGSINGSQNPIRSNTKSQSSTQTIAYLNSTGRETTSQQPGSGILNETQSQSNYPLQNCAKPQFSENINRKDIKLNQQQYLKEPSLARMTFQMQKDDMLPFKDPRPKNLQQHCLMQGLKNIYLLEEYMRENFEIRDTLPITPPNTDPNKLEYIHPWSLVNPDKPASVSFQKRATDQFFQINIELLKLYKESYLMQDIIKSKQQGAIGILFESPIAKLPMVSLYCTNNNQPSRSNDPQWESIIDSKKLEADIQRQVKLRHKQALYVNRQLSEGKQCYQPTLEEKLIEKFKKSEAVQQQIRKLKDLEILKLKHQQWLKEQSLKPPHLRQQSSPFSLSKLSTPRTFKKSHYPSDILQEDEFFIYQPYTSQFIVDEEEGPFTKKYSIYIDSHQVSSWKWYIYRIIHKIRYSYSGTVRIRHFESKWSSHTEIIKDWSIKNTYVHSLCFSTAHTKTPIRFEQGDEHQHHASDLKGLVILPLQLKLPNGYNYTYVRYWKGKVDRLVIYNDHASIRFLEVVNFGIKQEDKRDLTKKIVIENTKVWIGDDVLRKKSIVVMNNPSSGTSSIKIASNHPQHVKLIHSEASDYEIRQIQREYYPLLCEDQCRVFTKIDWKRDPKYHEIPFKFKFKILAYTVVIFFFAVTLKYLFPSLK